MDIKKIEGYEGKIPVAAYCAIYPPELCLAIARALLKEKEQAQAP